LVIGDFDTAKNLTNAEPTTLIGTIHIIAPEILKQDKTSNVYTMKADIYSLGMNLYEMITLLPPHYEERAPIRISEKVAAGILPTFPSEIEADPEYQGLIGIFQQCARLNPEERPAANELLELIILHLIKLS